MSFTNRLLLVVTLLLVVWFSQIGLRFHVNAAGPLPEIALTQPLESLPMEFGEWRGQDQPITDERYKYADSHLQRTYFHSQRPQSLTLWMVYSRRGADRGHHPEVCMMVAGKPEDPQARRVCEVEGHETPVQQYRFGRPGEYQWVFYWYYTMMPPQATNVDALQRLYQRLRYRPSSITVEVFAPEQDADDAEYVQEFVRVLDRHLQPLLGPHAVRGSQLCRW